MNIDQQIEKLDLKSKAEEMFSKLPMSQAAINKHYIEILSTDNLMYHKTLMQELITTFGLGAGVKAQQNS